MGVGYPLEYSPPARDYTLQRNWFFLFSHKPATVNNFLVRAMSSWVSPSPWRNANWLILCDDTVSLLVLPDVCPKQSFSFFFLLWLLSIREGLIYLYPICYVQFKQKVLGKFWEFGNSLKIIPLISSVVHCCFNHSTCTKYSQKSKINTTKSIDKLL